MSIAREIVKREKLLIVCSSQSQVQQQLWTDSVIKSFAHRIIFREIPSNDTWARDSGVISILVNEKPHIYDFTFNGWGLKFAANLDNQINRQLYKQKTFLPKVRYQGMKHYVLEGGSIETDGVGTILTTPSCLLSVNRNDFTPKSDIEEHLKVVFNVNRVFWIEHGCLDGDDTDGHIDTLARFCDTHTIAYVQCTDPDDPHFEALQKMEGELQALRHQDRLPYRLVPLPMADAVSDGNRRLPATYANFLIINSAVLLPFYGSPKDEIARQALQPLFSGREIIGIDCRPLIKQHGSLHCTAMHFPEGFL
jgi:agmatine/peptidylarginine deiminase